MKSYLNLLQHVMDIGEDRLDRTGVGTRGVFGYQWRHNMRDGFPLLTTKRVHFKSVLIELLWFLRGDTNVAFLRDNGVTIWDEWADKNGDLGPVYGAQWRFWTDPRKAIVTNGEATFGTIDQISILIDGLRTNPWSRRHIVSAWNPSDVPHMKLPPCHTLWQCHVSTKGELNLHLYARSIDSFLGLPFNIASYGLLLEILARLTKLQAGELVISFGDLHIYNNHFDQVATQLARDPLPLPALFIDPTVESLLDLSPASFELNDYEHHPGIKAPIAV